MARLPASLIVSLAALLGLAACGGGPRGDWRTEVGQPTPNFRLVEPRPPLALPPTLDLPPPAS